MIADQNRIEKLIGMLGSDFDGERAVAAKKIAEIAKAQKKSLPELFASVFSRTVYQERVVYRDVPQPEKPPTIGKVAELQRVMHKCRATFGTDPNRFLTDWERDFCADIIARAPVSVSDKQAAVIERIINKIKLGACG